MINTDSLIITALILLLSGALGFAMRRDFLRKVVAFNVMSTGTFLLLVGLAPEEERAGPVFAVILILLFIVTTTLSWVALTMRTALVRTSGETEPDEGDPP